MNKKDLEKLHDVLDAEKAPGHRGYKVETRIHDLAAHLRLMDSVVEDIRLALKDVGAPDIPGSLPQMVFADRIRLLAKPPHYASDAIDPPELGRPTWATAGWWWASSSPRWHRLRRVLRGGEIVIAEVEQYSDGEFNVRADYYCRDGCWSNFSIHENFRSEHELAEYFDGVLADVVAARENADHPVVLPQWCPDVFVVEKPDPGLVQSAGAVVVTHGVRRFKVRPVMIDGTRLLYEVASMRWGIGPGVDNGFALQFQHGPWISEGTFSERGLRHFLARTVA